MTFTRLTYFLFLISLLAGSAQAATSSGVRNLAPCSSAQECQQAYQAAHDRSQGLANDLNFALQTGSKNLYLPAAVDMRDALVDSYRYQDAARFYSADLPFPDDFWEVGGTAVLKYTDSSNDEVVNLSPEAYAKAEEIYNKLSKTSYAHGISWASAMYSSVKAACGPVTIGIIAIAGVLAFVFATAFGAHVVLSLMNGQPISPKPIRKKKYREGSLEWRGQQWRKAYEQERIERAERRAERALMEEQ